MLDPFNTSPELAFPPEKVAKNFSIPFRKHCCKVSKVGYDRNLCLPVGLNNLIEILMCRPSCLETEGFLTPRLAGKAQGRDEEGVVI